MKRILILLAFVAFAATLFAQREPKGWKVSIDKGMKPDDVQITDNAWEFYGTVPAGNKKGERSYAITVKKEIISKLPTGTTIVLEGAQLEPGVKEMCLTDYYNNNRKEIEEEKKEDLEDARSGLKGKKFFSKEWFDAQSDISAAKKAYKKEKRITSKNLKKLRKRLEQRTGVNCVYVYNYGSSTGSPSSPGNEGDDGDLPDD